MKLEPKLLEPQSHRVPEAPRVGFMLKAHNDVVGVAHDDDVAFGFSPPPLVGPEVEDVVQVDVSKQRRDHCPSPCWAQALPVVISANPSLRVWTSTPAAPRVHVPVTSPRTLAFPGEATGRRDAKSPTATSVGGNITELQSFTNVQTHKFARHTGSSHPCVLRRRAAVAFTSAPIRARYLPLQRICFPSKTGQLTEGGLPPPKIGSLDGCSASRVALSSSFMHAIVNTPAESTGCMFRSLPHRYQPSPQCRRVGFRINLFEACSTFTGVTACMIAKSLEGPSTPKASTTSLPPSLLRLLPAGATVAGRDSHPLNDSAFSRRTTIHGLNSSLGLTAACAVVLHVQMLRSDMPLHRTGASMESHMDAQAALAIDVVTVIVALAGLVLAVVVMFCGWSSIRDEQRHERRRHGKSVPHWCDRAVGANDSHERGFAKMKRLTRFNIETPQLTCGW